MNLDILLPKGGVRRPAVSAFLNYLEQREAAAPIGSIAAATT